MATATVCITTPDVWDCENTDLMMGMEGTDHTVECAQAHIDHAMTAEWGIHDARWVVDSIEVHPGGVHEGEHHAPFTVAYGGYEDVNDE